MHSEDEAIIQKKVAIRDEAAVKDEAAAGGDKVKDEEASSKRHLDLLDLLLAAKDDDGRGLTLGEVRNEVDTFLFAGTRLPLPILFLFLLPDMNNNNYYNKLVPRTRHNSFSDNVVAVHAGPTSPTPGGMPTRG